MRHDQIAAHMILVHAAQARGKGYAVFECTRRAWFKRFGVDLDLALQ